MRVWLCLCEFVCVQELDFAFEDCLKPLVLSGCLCHLQLGVFLFKNVHEG